MSVSDRCAHGSQTPFFVVVAPLVPDGRSALVVWLVNEAAVAEILSPVTKYAVAPHKPVDLVPELSMGLPVCRTMQFGLASVFFSGVG